MTGPDFDEDALIAGVELVNRSGARSCEIGHTGDDEYTVKVFGKQRPRPTDDEVTWWATAQYNGARIMEQGHRDPVAAVEALARRVLRGAKCVGCRRTVSLSGLASKQATRCRWTREGRHWMPACESGRQRLQQRLVHAGAERQ